VPSTVACLGALKSLSSLPDGSYMRRLAKFARVDVVVLDDRGRTPPCDVDCHDPLEICEDRYGTRS
jgi:hypothetical protein